MSNLIIKGRKRNVVEAWGDKWKRKKITFSKDVKITACIYADRNNPVDGLTPTMCDREGRYAGAVSWTRQEWMGLTKYRKKRKGLRLEHRQATHRHRREGGESRPKCTRWVDGMTEILEVPF